MSPPPPTPPPVHFGLDGLRHFLNGHCQSQNPAERQCRDDFIRVLGEHRILPLGQPAGDPGPFIARSLEWTAEAITRGQYVTYDEHSAGGDDLHTGAAALTRTAVEFALRQHPAQWDFITAYFKHESDLEAKTFRSAVRRRLDCSTDGTRRWPAPTFRVWVCDRARYRMHIRFGDPKAWGEDGGEFDLNRLPPW